MVRSPTNLPFIAHDALERRAFEGHGWVFCRIEIIGTFQIPVPHFIVRVERSSLGAKLENGVGEVILRGGDFGGVRLEIAVHLRNHVVVDGGADFGMAFVQRPGL